METLTEPGALPLPRHPTSPCGFYPKREAASYYFSDSSPPRPVFGGYPSYSQVPEADSWTNNQKASPRLFSRHQRREEDMQEDRSENTGSYVLSSHAQTAPHRLNSSFRQQSHNYTSSPLHMSQYSHDHVASLARERDDTDPHKHTDDSNNPSGALNKANDTFTSQKLKFGLHVSVNQNDCLRADQNSMRSSNMHAPQYNYNTNDIHGKCMDANQREIYYQRNFHETPQSLKNVYSKDAHGVISYSQNKTKSVVASEDEHIVSGDNGIAATDFKERINSLNSHKTSIISRGINKETPIEPDEQHPIYRREMEYRMHKGEGKLGDVFTMRDRTCLSLTSDHSFQEKRIAKTAESFDSSLRNKQGNSDNEALHPAQNNTMVPSPESCHRESLSHQYRHVTSPKPHCPTSPNKPDIDGDLQVSTQSITDHNLQLSTQSITDHNLQLSTRSTADYNLHSPSDNVSGPYSSTPVKPASSPIERKFTGEVPPLSSLCMLPSPLLPHLKHSHNGNRIEDYQKARQVAKENSERVEYKESPKSDNSHLNEKLSTINAPISQTPEPLLLNKNSQSPSATTAKLSPCRLSPDGFAKLNSSDSCEDDSLEAKREVFSDDAEDNSTCEESINHSPTFSPFHDPSIGYSHHFPHPFFPSQPHGPFPGFRFQFGSLPGPSDRTLPGPGFPFGSMPGVPQDMALVGHMHSSRSHFIGSSPSGPGPGRQATGEKDVFFCHLCSYSGKSKPEFDNHMNTHFEFNCPHCDYTSRTEGRLKRHIKDFHTEDNSRRSMPGRPKVYKCKQCPFSATEKDTFWTHSRTHIKEDKLLQCPRCSFVTEYKHHLEYHLRNHFGSKPFKCPKCNYSCVNKSMLNSHMKSHTNVYQYRCSECTYATKYCHSLKLHLKKYNHKPATVLNQDGSLPQGLDVESSGLSIVSKRGPPRGPRGTRKDINGPYMSHLFEMPQMPLGVAGMNPILNGVMPFWPMLPQTGIAGHPSAQTGLLPGIRNLAQQMAIRANHRGSMDISKMDDTKDEITEDSKDNMRNKEKSCSLCNFIAESREELCFHLMQVHKEEAKEVVMSYGFSETFLFESFRRINPDTKLGHQKMSEPLKELDSDHGSSEFPPRNTNNSFIYKENVGSLQNRNDQKDESSKTPPTFWPPSSQSENYSRSLEVYNPRMDNKNEDNSCSSNSGLDILQQMTLKFGSGFLSDTRLPAREEDQKPKKVSLEEPQGSVQDNVTRFNPTPLDLTKPKSVSPPMFNNSQKQEDSDGQVRAQERKRSHSDNDVIQSEELETGLKRPLKEIEDTPSENNFSITEMSSIAPRKRSRKGKAYKLDTLCLKLQNRQSNLLHEEDEQLNMEINFHHFKPIQATEEDEHKYISKVDKNKQLGTTDVGCFHASVKDIMLDEGRKGTESVTDSLKEKVDTEFTMNDMVKNGSMAEMDEENIEKKECDANTEKKRLLQDEAEVELQKLQRSLQIFNQGLNSGSPEYSNDEITNKGKVHLHKEDEDNSTYEIDDDDDDDSSEATIEEQIFSDKETNDTVTPLKQSSQKHLEDDAVNQVELINTVLENRKKTVPPAVRRGTELAWKLLNDPVNPVTMLPLPVDAVSTSQPLNISSKFPDFVSNPAVARQVLKPHHSLHQYSHSHHSPQLNQTHNPNVQQSPHHPHTQQSLMSMKPHLSMPTPSTPMAYIPPTNRLMSEPTIALPGSRSKPSHQELYECTFCDLSFRDCVMYTVHMGYHSNQNPFQCNSCGAVSRDKVEFFLHIARSPHA